MSIAAYRVLISPWLAPRCRFLPTCSVYAEQALRRHGLRAGTWLALRRLARCHPFGGHGIDEVPPAPTDTSGRAKPAQCTPFHTP